MLAAQTRAARLDFEVRQPRGKRVSLRKLLRTGSRDALLARIETSPAAGLGSALASPRYAWAWPHRELYSSPEVRSAVYQRMTKSRSAVSLWPGQRRGIFTGEHGYRGGGFVGGERSGSAWCALVSANSAAARAALAGDASECPGASAVTAIPSLPSPTASVRVIDRQVGSRTYSTQ